MLFLDHLPRFCLLTIFVSVEVHRQQKSLSHRRFPGDGALWGGGLQARGGYALYRKWWMQQNQPWSLLQVRFTNQISAFPFQIIYNWLLRAIPFPTVWWQISKNEVTFVSSGVFCQCGEGTEWIWRSKFGECKVTQRCKSWGFDPQWWFLSSLRIWSSLKKHCHCFLWEWSYGLMRCSSSPNSL